LNPAAFLISTLLLGDHDFHQGIGGASLGGDDADHVGPRLAEAQ
jgi:hypothetical protein